MTDYCNPGIRNHLSVPAHVRLWKRRLSLSWALSGKDAVILIGCGVMAGILIGGALIALAWR